MKSKKKWLTLDDIGFIGGQEWRTPEEKRQLDIELGELIREDREKRKLAELKKQLGPITKEKANQ